VCGVCDVCVCVCLGMCACVMILGSEKVEVLLLL